MTSRWYGIAVVLLWLGMMTWLLTQKVLPALRIGDPPSYRTIVAQEHPKPVGWRLMMNGRQLGWAWSTIRKSSNLTTDVRSRVHFDNVPIDRLIPSWLRGIVSTGSQPLGKLQLEVESKMLLDPLGRLVDFDSALRSTAEGPSLVRLQGSVEGTKLKLSVHSGTFQYDPEISLRPNDLLGDNLAPQMRLPGLRQGQTWTVPSYSPLSPLNQPIEILQAKVEELTTIRWNNSEQSAWLVVYRSDMVGESGNDKDIRSRLWVKPDGAVLRQQVQLFDSTLVFIRMSDAEAADLEKKYSSDESLR